MRTTQVVIKRYTSPQDIMNDLHEIRRSLARTIMDYDVPLAMRIQETTAAVMRSIRRSGRGPDSVRPPKTPPSTRRLQQTTDTLDQLNAQDQILANILVNLTNQFKNTRTDGPDVERMRRAADSLRTQVRHQIESVMEMTHARAESNSSPVLRNAVKVIVKNLEQRMRTRDDQSDIKYVDGLIKGVPAHTAYVTFENLKNARGEIEAEVVFAITEIGGVFYCNPAADKVRTLSQLRLGDQVKVDTKADVQTQTRQLVAGCMAMIQNQLAADAHLSAISRRDVPIGKEDLSFDKSHAVAKVTFGDQLIMVDLKPTIKTQQAAENVAQDIFRVIHSAMVASDPQTRDKIKYAIRKTSGHYRIEYVFTSSKISSGKTIGSEDEKFLSQRFSPDEVRLIRRALSEK